MGAGASVNDVASHVKGHGSAYNYIAAAIEENGVDGKAILAYDGPESILDDLKVKRLHRNQLTRDYALLGCDLSEKELTELKQDSYMVRYHATREGSVPLSREGRLHGAPRDFCREVGEIWGKERRRHWCLL